MKFKIILTFLLILPFTSASIYSYLENLDSNYLVLVEDTAPGSDSLAATDIVTGIQRITSNKIILKYKLVSENTQNSNLILIGNPCDNKLIQIDCDSWSYKKGEALIQVSGSNLIVSGTEPDDTRRAAKIIANYKDYSSLKDKDKIIIKGTTLELPQIQIQEQKPEEQMTCGDGVCESGEICAKDCKKLTCNEVCTEQGYIRGTCRFITDSEKPVCMDVEKSLGLKYCEDNQFCCCMSEEVEIKKQEKQGFFRRVINWFKDLF